eukprot:CAMPEP_0180198948 /NCGR_PEP_ID=MMETSP0987-20121128/5449_1 /TAXON_ID=697907 /ORGANISM="non described non described, Strain CCMP2293" /LENGTH=364 /DNA_ID=CAMNT_0022154003 /DNA_START=33 /DNA_END=1126 /DNA_ORIENTATION=-
MGMKPDASGALAPVPGYLTEQIDLLVNSHQTDPMPTVTVKEYADLIDSCDMGPAEWRLIANDIFDNYERYDGFLVIMGTDTMAYSASALSFMLENLAKTVVFTGSQIPFCRTFSDARRNLLFSMSLACTLDIPEVCLFFDDKLFRASRCRKADSGNFDAFSSPNFQPLATVGLTVEVNTSLLLPQPKGRFRVHLDMDTKIMVVKLVPSFDTTAILRLASNPEREAKALILELYGTGNAPRADRTFVEAMEAAKASGLVVMATSQCARGPVIPANEQIMTWLETLGIIPAHDMTTEATCAKLAYLFGKKLTVSQVASSMALPMRGELTPPSETITPVEQIGPDGEQQHHAAAPVAPHSGLRRDFE